jgi:Na+-driven multidrug efflux pump
MPFSAFHVLDTWLMVYRFDLGFSGAAISTSISNWLMFVFLLAIAYIRHQYRFAACSIFFMISSISQRLLLFC